MPIKFSMGMKAPKKSKPGSGDIATDCAEELGEVEKGFRARAATESKRKEHVTDSEFWVCLCFQTREQVEEFLRASKLAKPTEKYIDGRKVAKALNIALPADPAWPTAKTNSKLADMAMELDDYET